MEFPFLSKLGIKKSSKIMIMQEHFMIVNSLGGLDFGIPNSHDYLQSLHLFV